MKTEAFLLTKKGTAEEAFRLSEVALPALKENDILIATEAFGLNYADVMARRGLYREAPPFPCVIGYEVVGKIIETGSSADTSLIGKRVVAFTRFGGYAKHAVTTKDAIAEIGEMPVNDALALATQGVTAYYMTNYISPLRTGEHVLIHAAAGGVGTLLIQLAKHAGAIVIAKVSSKEKQEKCLSLGADYTINYRNENYAQAVERIIGSKKLDVSFNPIGGDTFKTDKQLLGFGSRIFLFGGSQLAEGKFGMLSQLNFLRKMGVSIPVFLMMQSKSLIGVNMLKIADNKPLVLQWCMQEVIRLYHEGKLTTENGGDFSYAEMHQAHNLLESGKSIGKIAVHW
ncbi:zinc-binding dehydrogenase [Crocinitomicaceae bacterium CZZ-1]|uniref:Zinc-binding dehydrogenase n=1 Tax=Taishania pollutisoli TaxID=2766479 RepID=A0A8J6TZN1_9FLAO|nr:zinc-binding dehydrogenase [Taishania pollutisoli]MBC9812323.1 zinc-binding dehydrogenase [Taishania pollutisoli]MBX2950300.1 zinc-binding dehydrogenase [Crocinitomicaceae bacterium]NGF74308.1 zinc-binding dehydrogenase [Fluviicola sp. SGL-29]